MYVCSLLVNVFYALAFHKKGMDPPFNSESALKVKEYFFVIIKKSLFSYSQMEAFF